MSNSYKNNLQIIKFSIIMIVICFASVVLFSLPAFSNFFDLSKENGIGSSIGGITAPVIGIVSSILLYLALSRQTESNFEQKLKNESDFIFLLLNQLDNEFNNFYFKLKIDSVETKYLGIEGLNEFCKRIGGDWNMNNMKSQIKSFKSLYESGQIISIIDSFNLISKRIEKAQLSEEMKQLFIEKLNSFYETKLKDNFLKLNESFKDHEYLNDDWSNKINIFVERYK